MRIGTICLKEETGTIDIAKAAAKISTGKGDYGGKSYGMFQYASNPKIGSLTAFLKETGYDESFQNTVIGTDIFDDRWKELAKTEAFQQAQYDYGVKKYASEHLDYLKTEGVDIEHLAIKELALATGVQYGDKSNIFKKAIEWIKSNGKITKELSLQDLINMIVDYKKQTRYLYFKKTIALDNSMLSKMQARDERERVGYIGLLKEV